MGDQVNRAVSGIATTLVLLSILPAGDVSAQSFPNLPRLPPPIEYGHVQIDRLSSLGGQASVTFSHWSHRMKYTCRVCHFELEFEMLPNATQITEEENRNGKYCGACHDGKTAFGHTAENCGKCHTGGTVVSKEQFAKVVRSFPKAPFGNKVDWVRGVADGEIKPKQSIRDASYAPKPFNDAFELPAARAMIPPARFSHEVHNRWLDCRNCHPDLFAIKRNLTQHFEMRYILERKFCGACHLTVAFPLDDCRRCHAHPRN